jgi:hypothetical protein
MESDTRKLRAETYRAQLALCEQIRDDLAKNLDNQALTIGERIALVNRCDAAVTEIHSLQLLLQLIDRKDSEERQSAATH